MDLTPMGLNNIKNLQLTHFRDGKKFPFTLKINIELFCDQMFVWDRR